MIQSEEMLSYNKHYLLVKYTVILIILVLIAWWYLLFWLYGLRFIFVWPCNVLEWIVVFKEGQASCATQINVSGQTGVLGLGALLALPELLSAVDEL